MPDLNFDCQLMNLGKLNLIELLEVAQTSKQLAALTSDAFRRQYGSKTIEIYGTIVPLANNRMEVMGSTIRILSPELYFKVLQHFGHVISRIRISYIHIKVEQRNKIHSFIGKYCSDSLVSLEFYPGDDTALFNWQQPFAKVAIIQLFGIINSSQNANMELNEIFPNLRQLSLNHVTTSNPSILDIAFQHLEDIEIVEHNNDGFPFDNRSPIEKLFTKNANIKNLQLFDCDLGNYIEMMNKVLPHLQTLGLSWNEYAGKLSIANQAKFDVNTLIEFMEQRSELNRLSLVFPGEKVYDQLNEHFKDGWAFNGTKNHFSIERLA